MISGIKIRPNDTVAVLLNSIKKNETISVGVLHITAIDDIPRGHKIALCDIQKGDFVIKYGFPIGKAVSDIKQGSLIHIHNMKTNLSLHENYAYHPDFELLETVKPDYFNGYVRNDGRSAVRNEIWIIPGVGCVADMTQRMAAQNQQLVQKYGLDGLYAFPHQFGCSQLGDDNTMTRQLLSSLANHPNAGAVLIVSLGCENNIPSEFQKCIIETAGKSWDPQRVKFIVCQEVEDEMAVAAQYLEDLAAYASKFHRQPVPVSELVLGMKCGGSDGMSGVTANPLLGFLGDMVIARGGSSMITEVPEMFGAEDLLLNRCVSKDVFTKAAEMLNNSRDYFVSHGQPVYENPAPGNYAGGISSLEEKSLGCVQKGGIAPINDVNPYAEPVHTRGLTLLAGPGSDLISATNLVAAGAQIILFTTGRGTPYCTAVPTIKLSTNSTLFNKKKNWIDFDAGTIADGEPISDAALRLYQYLLKVASGEIKTKGEENGYRKIAIFKNGVTV